jgi:hypothetical protein
LDGSSDFVLAARMLPAMFHYQPLSLEKHILDVVKNMKMIKIRLEE